MLKNIAISLLVASSLLNAKVTLSKKLIENDIDAEQYQLFVTKTVDVPLDELTSKVVFEGEMKEYIEANKLKEDSKLEALISNRSTVGKYVSSAFFATAFENNEYVKCVDFYSGDTLKSRIVKYIIADDDLSKKEREEIYKTSNDTSYHYNDGHIVITNFIDKRAKRNSN